MEAFVDQARRLLGGKTLPSTSLAVGVLVLLLLVLRSRAMLQTSTGRFGKKSTAKEVIDGFSNGNPKYLAGKTALVTGGNSGIGLETCKALASAGCKVILCSRSIKNAEDAIKTEITKPGYGNYIVSEEEAKRLIKIKQLDLMSLKSVETLANDILSTESKIDLLVLNAGIMMTPTCERTAEGFESQFGVNHMAHAYLYYLLKPMLMKQTSDTRIISLSSLAHQYAGGGDNFKFDASFDLNFEKGRKYTPMKGYGQSKLANIIFAKVVAQETAGKPITAVSVHPGVITQTKLYRSTRPVFNFVVGLFVSDKNIVQGAATTVWACVSPRVRDEDMRGSYLVDCCPALPLTPEGRDEDGSQTKGLRKVTLELLEKATGKKLD